MATLKAEPLLPVIEQQASSPAQLLSFAVNSKMDLAYIKELMAMKKEWEADEARKAFIAAKSKFHSLVPVIKKDKNVHFEHKEGGGSTDYNYAPIGTIGEKIKDAEATCGLSHDWITVDDGKEISVRCKISHAGGHFEIGEPLKAAADGTGKKSPIQAKGSTITFLQRYTLISAYGLTISDGSDDDGRSSASSGVDDAHYEDVVVETETGKVKLERPDRKQVEWCIDEIMAGRITVDELKGRYFFDIQQIKALENTEKATKAKSNG